MAVNAFISPPTASIAAEISSADAASGALEQQVLEVVRGARPGPGSRRASRRRPRCRTRAERTAGIASVTTRSPPGSTVRRTQAAVASVSSVRVEPGRCSRARARGVPRARRGARDASSSDQASARRRVVGRRRRRRSSTGDQRELAAGVDLGDLDLDLLADVTTSSTFSTRLPPASLRSCEMCSRPSLPGSSETNAPKVGGLDHRAEVALADLGHVRVGDRVDHAPARPRPWGRRSAPM